MEGGEEGRREGRSMRDGGEQRCSKTMHSLLFYRPSMWMPDVSCCGWSVVMMKRMRMEAGVDEESVSSCAAAAPPSWLSFLPLALSTADTLHRSVLPRLHSLTAHSPSISG